MIPPEGTLPTSFRPFFVSWNDETELLPALTAKTSLPFADTTTSFCESRIAQPGPQPTACVLPFPPVPTFWRSLSVPFA